jgi:hypothetical protein
MRFSSSHDRTGRPSPDRLVLAADAILLAEHHPADATVLMWRDDSKPAREGFSCHELMEAMNFLRRLGLVNIEASWPRQMRRGTQR